MAVTDEHAPASEAWADLPLLIRATILIAVLGPCLLIVVAVLLLLAYLVP